LSRRKPFRRTHAENADGSRRLRESVAFWCAVATAVIALLTFFLTFGDKLIASAPAAKRHPEGRLVIAQVYMNNGPERSYVADDYGQVQTLASSPTVEAMLLNRSRQRVLVTHASVTIEAYAAFNLCFSQGGGPVPRPNPYVIALPVNPLPDERTIEVPIYEQLRPEDVDRIALRFSSDVSGLGGYGIYLLHIRLRVYGEPKVLDLGRFAISTPASLPTFAGYLPNENAFLQQFVSGSFKSARLSATWCFKRNLASLQQVLAPPSTRAPQLELFDQPALASRWPQLQDHLPPRQAATRLIGEHQATDAVYAASQTGDAAFETRIRGQAAGQLFAAASSEVSLSPPTFTEQEVLLALGMQPSERGRTLLREIRQRLAQQRR
jgi:hypothetical protein